MSNAASSELETRAMGKIARRIVPFLMFCYFIAYLDRVNVGFAGASMRQDLGLSAAAFGGAAGIFFIAYFFFEVPSNLALNRFGARKWIARIMFTWGIVSGAQALVTGVVSFNIVRLLLGVAEAGFFPGIIFFLTLWFPSAYRARIVGIFMAAIPISTVIGAPISGEILQHVDGALGLRGWQWIYVLEAVPALIVAFIVFFYLTDRPADAKWLTPEERQWMQARLDAERANRESIVRLSLLQSILKPRVLLLGCVYMMLNVPQYGLSFFLPQIVKGFGVSAEEAGFITMIPYIVGAIGMVVWSRHSDKTGERVWHVVIPFIAMVIGLGLAAMIDDPTLKIVVLSVAAWGFFAILPVFWTLPTAFLTGVGAAAGIATVNSVGNLGGYFGPQVFGYLKDVSGGDAASLLFLAGAAVVGIVLTLSLGHNRALERAPQPAE